MKNNVKETFAQFMNKDNKFKNEPLCVEKKVFGKLFHASPKGVKRREALNKLANNRLVLLFRRLAEGKKPEHKKRNSRVLDCIFRLDWLIFNSSFQLPRIKQRSLTFLFLMFFLVACEKQVDDLIPLSEFPPMTSDEMDNSVINHINELVAQVEIDTKQNSLEQQFVAWKKLANALHNYELYGAAELAYLNALRFDLDKAKLNYQLGHLYRLQAKYESSNERFLKSLKLSKDYPPIYNNLAENYFDMGELEPASKYIQQSLDFNKNEPYALQIYGNILSQSGQIDLAVKMYEKALSQQPQANKLYFLLAQLYQQKGLPEMAEKYRSKGGDDSVRTLDLWLSEVTEEIQGFNYFVKKAQQHFNKGDYQGAIHWVDKASADRPEGFTINMIKGVLQVGLGNYQDGLRYFEQAHDIRPRDFKVNLNLGTVYKQVGAYQKSIQFYQQALNIKPNHMVARINYADSLCQAGDYKQALNESTQLLETDVKQQALLLGVKCQIQHKRYHRAYLWVKEHIDEVRNNPAFIEYAVLLLVASPIDDDRNAALALSWLKTLMQKQPTNKQRQLLVMALMESNQFNEAANVLKQVKPSADLYLQNQYLKQLIAGRQVYRLSEF